MDMLRPDVILGSILYAVIGVVILVAVVYILTQASTIL